MKSAALIFERRLLKRSHWSGYCYFVYLALCRNVHLAVMFRDWISTANIKHAQKMEHLGIKCLAHVNLIEHFKGYAL